MLQLCCVIQWRCFRRNCHEPFGLNHYEILPAAFYFQLYIEEYFTETVHGTYPLYHAYKPGPCGSRALLL